VLTIKLLVKNIIPSFIQERTYSITGLFGFGAEKFSQSGGLITLLGFLRESSTCLDCHGYTVRS